MHHARHLTIGAALLIAACGPPSAGIHPTDVVPTDGGAIRFNLHEISAESRDCSEPAGKCARVKVTYPATAGGGTAAVRDNIDLFIDHDFVNRMRGFVPEDVGNGIGDVEGLAAAFLAQWRAFGSPKKASPYRIMSAWSPTAFCSTGTPTRSRPTPWDPSM